MMTLQPAVKVSLPPAPTFLGALKNIGRGIYGATARFANYAAATSTTTTRTSSYTGTNPNSTISQIQRVGMNWTAEDVAKNTCIGWAYILQRVNYCSSQINYVPATGDTALDEDIKQYLEGKDGYGGVFANMGVDCSMQDAFSRTADIETPIRGDAGLIIWRDAFDNIRLIEWSADQLGEIYNFTLPRNCGLRYTSDGYLEETSGDDCVYLSGRYFRGPDCVAYNIYERTNSWYGFPKIYPACDVIYFRDPASFRGVRGVTKFATAIQHMEKGEELFQLGMNAALRQSKTAIMVYNANGQPDEVTYETIEGVNGQLTNVARVPSGPLTEYYYTGEEAKFMSPDSPGPELIQGVETSDERVALALGVNYAFLISATKVGGAPSRLEVNKASKEWRRIQNRISRPKLSRIRDVVLLDGARKGALPFHPNLLCGAFVLPISASVDAFYDAKENVISSRAGFEAPQDIIAESNRKASEVLAKKRQWAVMAALEVDKGNAELAAAGSKLVITTDDIAQISDNIQQSAAAESLETGGTTTGTSATKAA